MDAARLRDFAARYTAAWCSQDAASVAAFFAEGGSLKINDGAPSVGRAAITGTAQGFMAAFPDMVVAMDGLRVDGNRAVYRWTLTGTNTGPGGTGRSVRISGYEEWTIGEDGLIAQSMGHFDEAEYGRQLAGGAASEFVIEADPKPDEVQYLEDRLYEFNSRATRITDGEWLSIFVKDDGGRIVAGICGNTWGGCCEIRQFWVEESRRGRGLGTRLLGAAEDEARRRGCRQIFLATFTFQAPAFYTKRGFEILARIDDHPRGHQNLILRKRLGETG